MIGFYETMTSVNFRASSTKTSTLDEGDAPYGEESHNDKHHVSEDDTGCEAEGFHKSMYD